MKRSMRVVLGLVILATVVIVAIIVCLQYQHTHPRIRRTVGREAEWHLRHLNARFSSVYRADKGVGLVEGYPSNLTKSVMTVGSTIVEPGDDGNYMKYTIVGIDKDGAIVDYFSHFDHRTFGELLIEEDTGTVKLKWKFAQ